MAVLLLTLTGCQNRPPSDAPAPQNTGTVTVGALLPLTGSWETHGQSAASALEAAQDVIRSHWADEQLNITVTTLDTASDPATALTQLEALHQQGIRIVIGPMSSAEAAHVRDFADQNDILLISPSATASQLSQNDNLLKLSPTDKHQSDALIRLMKKDAIRQLAVLHIDDIYGHSFYSELTQAVGDAGITLLPGLSLAPASPDYPGALTQLEKQLADQPITSTAVLLIESDQRAKALIQTIPSDSPVRQVKWYAGDAIIGSEGFLADAQVASFAATTSLEGFTLALDGDLFDASLPLTQRIIADRHQGPISPYALTTWDALWLIAHTHQLATGADTATFKAALLEESHRFGNAFSFLNPLDENGDTVPARYARFRASEKPSGGYQWQLTGAYVRSAHFDPFVTDIQKSYTTETGTAVIGALLPLTGQSSEMGLEARQVLDLAASVANKYLTVRAPGLTFSLEIRDTAGDPQQALQVLTELHERGINAFVGPYSSAELKAVESFATENGITLISPAATAPSLAAKNRIMRLAVNDTMQVNALISLLTEQGLTEVIVLHRDDIYGRELAQTFAASFEGRTNLLAYDPSAVNTAEIVASASQLISGDASKTAVLAASFEEISDILQAVPDENPLLDLRWFGTDGTARLSTLINNQDIATKGAQIRFTASSFTHHGDAFAAIHPSLTANIPERKKPLTDYGINTYDAYWFLAATLAETGPQATADQIWSTLTRSPYFIGTGGPFTVDENSDRTIGSFHFHSIVEKDGGYQWKLTAWYQNTYQKQGVLETY
ncbi:ABC transporter substrate-binding protein [Heliorestis acidaminivorans]|nr:ABC transporter substrate-binding protein [Heliorestis acidaminivorans]